MRICRKVIRIVAKIGFFLVMNMVDYIVNLIIR